VILRHDITGLIADAEHITPNDTNNKPV